MAVRAELHLGIRDFQGNLKRATADVRKESDIMKRESAGVGAALAGGLKGAGKNLLGVLGLGSAGMAVKDALTRADDLADLKIKLNETAETLQKVDFAAQQAASVGVDQVSKSVLKLEKNLGELDNKNAAAALDNFGLSAGKLQAMPLDQKLLALSDAFIEARRTGTGVADLTDLLGRSGTELIPLLGLGKEAIEAMFENAPALADDVIDRMARLNDEFDAMVIKSKAGLAEIVGGLVGWKELLGDIISSGSIDSGFAEYESRNAAGAKADKDAREAREASAAAIDAAAAAAEASKAEAAAAEDLTKALERVAKIKESIADGEMARMSQSEQIAELERRKQQLLDGSIANFPTFDRSAAGLKALAESRDKTAGLPAEGVNSSAEAWGWYQEALELSEKQRAMETALAKEEADKAKKRADDLAAARSEAEAGGFALMNPEQQAADLKDRLGKALGINVSSSSGIEAGIAKQRKAVEDARASGDIEAEKAALDRLNESQQLAAEFSSAADNLAPAAPGGGVGSVAGLLNQVFGRDPQAQQLDELKRAGDLARDQRDRLDKIITKMDEPPPPVVFGAG
jgi:hypothetical protein